MLKRTQIAADVVLIFLALVASLFLDGSAAGVRIIATISIPILYIMSRITVASHSVSIDPNGLIQNIADLTKAVGSLNEKYKSLDASINKLDLARRHDSAGLKSAISEAHDVVNEFAKLVVHPALNKK